MPRPVLLTDTASFPLWLNLVIFAGAAGIVWLAGTRLARDLGQLSSVTGIDEAIIGMLLLGVITSLPEIANVLVSSYMGNPALAANNLLGSASINIVLLALADALIGRDALTSVVARPSTLMQSVLCMIILALIAVVISMGDYTVIGVGIGSVGVFLACMAAFWLSAGYGGRSPWRLENGSAKKSKDGTARKRHGRPTLRSLGIRIAAAAAAILVAGYALAQTGDGIAEQTGLGAGLVGFLLIGFATSLPELSTITSAMRLRQHEMAIGEVLGTNFVNLALLFPADLVYSGGAVLGELGRFEIISALLGLVLTGLYLVGLLEHRDRTILRMGYDSLAVLIVFIGGVCLLFAAR